ncbi:amidohydrolase family protein [Aureobasidium subglaciale]|nr:amidohydrolase family protein [Aureobasidium subglaciale]KAI5213429.1 amidohydrolase family protein [Aureobasidium subglaciale]KAI5214986.1 amidohydrolase family protein [Aureobasidium subglaciale]KAI5253018.1 amidohydrolase family protein [Aureobasidium subglaciale]
MAILVTVSVLLIVIYLSRSLWLTTAFQWIDITINLAVAWPERPPLTKIDTHHHFVPDFYAQAVQAAGGDPSGWSTPRWSLESSQNIMKRLGIKTAILSVTAPGACILKGQASFDLARKLNVESAKIRDQNPGMFGFFANLANVLDTNAALEEIRFALDDLKADGVTLFTRYGDGNTYLGHADIEPIWKELDRRGCVVFVHPTHPVDTTQVNARMPQPVVDYPHETTRTAYDMLLQGTRSKYPACRVILSHAGGTLPYLISRTVTPLKNTQDITEEAQLGTTYDQMIRDFCSFHFDLALSSSPAVLQLLMDIVPHDHILYGSDFPYAPLPAYPAFLEELEDFDMTPELRDKISFGNASKLVPRLARLHAS